VADRSRSRIDAALAGLDADGLAALVADLRAARGETVRREGRRVVVEGGPTVHAHDATGRLGRHHPRPAAPPDPAAVGADRVVTNGPAADRPGVDGPAAVRRRLRYGLARATADALCRRHLGCPVAPTAPDEAVDRGRRSAVTAAAGLLTAALAAGAGATVGGDRGSGVGERGGVAARTGRGVPADDAGDDPYAGVALAGEATDTPPGVRPDGVDDADRLAAAHAAALADRRYRWTLTYREYYRGRLVAARRQTVTVAGPSRYASRVADAGPALGTVPTVGGDVYADGRTRYEPTDEGVERTPVAGGTAPGAGDESAVERYVDRAARLVSWYLSVERATVGPAGADATVRIEAEGDPWPGTASESTTALVRADGLVWRLRRSHRLSERDVVVVVGFEYDALGTATVERPAWLDRPETGTGAGTNATG
jgi:hypothetical protein